MMPSEGFDTLAAVVVQEREALRDSCAQLDPRVLLFCAVRWFDWSFVATTNDAHDARLVHDALMGVPLLLGLIPAGHVSRGGWPMLISNSAWEQCARALVTRAARIAECERLMAATREGFASIATAGAGVRVTFLSFGMNLERFDIDDHSALMDAIRWVDKHEERELEMLRPSVAALTSRLVYRWQEHFIGYDADPFLDDFFHRKGMLWARNSMITDTFGGVQP